MPIPQDLSYLNRPIPKTVLLDTNPAHCAAQPDNAIVIPPWKGDPSDRALVNLIPFLEYIAVMGIPDVRAAIKSFEGKDIATEFAAREARMRAAMAAERAAAKPKRAGLGSWVDKVVRQPQPDGQQSLAEAAAEGKTIFDVIREQGMKTFRVMEKEIRENGEKWLKEEAELMKRMEDEQKKLMKRNPLAMFGVGGTVDANKIMEEMAREKAEQEKEGKK